MRRARSVGFEGSISRGDFSMRFAVGTEVDLDQVVARGETIETVADHLGGHVAQFELLADAPHTDDPTPAGADSE